MEGFADVIANDPALRDRMLASDCLVAWPSPEKVGLCNNPDAVRLNARLLIAVADFWCPQWDSPINQLKVEAPFLLLTPMI